MTSIPNPGDMALPGTFIGDPAITGPAENLNDAAVCSQLNSLLRGEISAAETYKMAIDKCSDATSSRSADVQMLRDMQEEHGRACQTLRDRIRTLGGEASNSSGAWGAWAQIVEGTASLFGSAAAIKALKEGEEHGLKDYSEALDDVDPTSAAMIESEFIPAQQRHIARLDQMISANQG